MVVKMRHLHMDIMLDPQATPLEMTQFRCRVAFVLLPLEHASVSVLAMFHANCHMPPVQHHKWPVKRKCSGGCGNGDGDGKFMTRSRATKRKCKRFQHP